MNGFYFHATLNRIEAFGCSYSHGRDIYYSLDDKNNHLVKEGFMMNTDMGLRFLNIGIEDRHSE